MFVIVRMVLHNIVLFPDREDVYSYRQKPYFRGKTSFNVEFPYRDVLALYIFNAEFPFSERTRTQKTSCNCVGRPRKVSCIQ